MLHRLHAKLTKEEYSNMAKFDFKGCFLGAKVLPSCLLFELVLGLFFSISVYADEVEVKGQWDISSQPAEQNGEVKNPEQVIPENISEPSLAEKESQLDDNVKEKLAVEKKVSVDSEIPDVTPNSETADVASIAVQANPEIESHALQELDAIVLGEAVSDEQQKKIDQTAKKQLRFSLDQQFQQLRDFIETENAFSEKLGEAYFSYGLLLNESSRYEEAEEALVNALHIQKINFGIYALEQRVVLKSLFETHFELDDTESFEDDLERILWIEGKNPGMIRDDTSFSMMTRVGNRYLDEFLRHPVPGQSSVKTLLRAKHHFLAAMRRHGGKPLNQVVLPYGELALISVMEGRVLPDVDKTAALDDNRLGRSSFLRGRDPSLASYFVNSYPQGRAYLEDYLRKAVKERKPKHAVYSLIGLGDLSSLFRQGQDARKYYDLAYQMATDTGETDLYLEQFSEPVGLPDFQYSSPRERIIPTRSSLLVPMVFDVNELGRVENVAKLSDDNEFASYYKKARRAAKRLLFRPKHIDGKAVAVNGFSFDVRVYARRDVSN